MLQPSLKMAVFGRIYYLSTAVASIVFGTLFFQIIFVTGSENCSVYDFPCEDGKCIDSGLWCDIHLDCLDGSDEKYCKKTTPLSTNPNICPITYFKCNDGPCIPLSGVCDGYNSCDDGSDEENCGKLDPSLDSGSTSSPSISESHPLEVNISAITTSSTANNATPQQLLKFEEPGDRHFTMLHTAQKQQGMARSWLLTQRKSDFGWDDETPRALTALYLSDVQQSIVRNESDTLMVKQLEIQLSLAIGRNETKAIKLVDLALYINALRASCKDPENFYGENLVQILRNGADAAQLEATFVNPSVYLTLCMNNATTFQDTMKLYNILVLEKAAMDRIDIQALAILSISCVYRNTHFFTDESIYIWYKKDFLWRMSVIGFPGNVYEASLLAQALQELKVTLPGLHEFILDQQQEDGSFGGILATYLALPVLAGKNFLHLKDHCGQKYSTVLAPIEVLKNSKRRKIHVLYSLIYGHPPELKQTIQMQVAEGMNFLDAMGLAQEINPKFRFMLDSNRDVPVVYSIGGIPNDAEKGLFWKLYTASSSQGGNSTRLGPFSGNIKQLVPKSGDEFVFWIRSL